MKTTALYVLAGLCWAGQALAEETAAPAECARCHGAQGVSEDPEVPILAGLSTETFVQAMDAYRQGKRPAHPVAFKPYSEAELARLAEFFAARPFVPVPQDAFPAMAAKGRQLHRDYCEKCHENEGRTDTRGVSILAGQWMPYLRHSLKDYRNRQREMPKKMAERLDALIENAGVTGMEDLVQYYGSLR